MTHDELLARINANLCDKVGCDGEHYKKDNVNGERFAFRAVVELHKPTPLDERGDVCLTCCPDLLTLYPCPTIQAIEKELE